MIIKLNNFKNVVTTAVPADARIAVVLKIRRIIVLGAKFSWIQSLFCTIASIIKDKNIFQRRSVLHD